MAIMRNLQRQIRQLARDVAALERDLERLRRGAGSDFRLDRLLDGVYALVEALVAHRPATSARTVRR